MKKLGKNKLIVYGVIGIMCIAFLIGVALSKLNFRECDNCGRFGKLNTYYEGDEAEYLQEVHLCNDCYNLAQWWDQ